MAQLGDLAAVVIVDVLSRAKNLDGGNTGLHRFMKPGHRQPLVHAHVRGENAIHKLFFRAARVSKRSCYHPLAVPSVLPSAAPCNQPPSARIAETSPCEFTRRIVCPRDLNNATVSGE